MNHGSQTIQQQGRIFEIGEETGSGEAQSGEGERGEESTKRHWATQPGKEQHFYNQHWMSAEIKMHSKRRVFPDWGYIGVRYMEGKRRDHAADYLKGRDRAIIQKRQYRQRPENKARARERQRKVRANKKNKVRMNLSRRLGETLKNDGSMKGHSILKYIGCNHQQLVKHLESGFKKGMTWSNYGTHWHVDHILPCASFDHSDSNQVAQCWHWTNLQPLWAAENVAKKDKITQPQMSLRLCVTH